MKRKLQDDVQNIKLHFTFMRHSNLESIGPPGVNITYCPRQFSVEQMCEHIVFRLNLLNFVKPTDVVVHQDRAVESDDARPVLTLVSHDTAVEDLRQSAARPLQLRAPPQFPDLNWTVY